MVSSQSQAPWWLLRALFPFKIGRESGLNLCWKLRKRFNPKFLWAWGRMRTSNLASLTPILAAYSASWYLLVKHHVGSQLEISFCLFVLHIMMLYISAQAEMHTSSQPQKLSPWRHNHQCHPSSCSQLSHVPNGKSNSISSRSYRPMNYTTAVI